MATLCLSGISILSLWLAAASAALAADQTTLTTPPVSNPRIYRESVRPNWFDGERRFWYRVVTGSNSHEFVLVDVESGKRSPAFDHKRLARSLSQAGVPEARAERLPLSRLQFDTAAGTLRFRAGTNSWQADLASCEVTTDSATNQPAIRNGLPLSSKRASLRTGEETSITFINRTEGEVRIFWLDPDGRRQGYGSLEPGGSRNQHTFAGHRWLVVDRDGRDIGLFEAEPEAMDAEIGGAPVEEAPPPERPRRRGPGSSGASPDGHWRISAENHNLVLRELPGGAETKLTEDGTSDDGFGSRIFWSPDSSRVAVLRTRKGDERKVHLVESSPDDQLQPKLHSFDYLKPGDQVDRARPCLFEIEGRRQITIADTLFPNPWSITEVRWSRDSSYFTFVYNQRGHQVLRVIAVDARTGEARAVVDEKSDTFIDYNGKFFYEPIENTEEILWMSERDGWNHLYLYDTRNGEVKNQVTRGEWVVRGIDFVDRERRQVWFQAGGIRPGQDPYFVHYCRVNFDGSGLVVLTEGDGNHTVQFSQDRRYLLDTWSRVDRAPVTELRRAEDGALVCLLEEADTRELAAATDWRPPQTFVAAGRDGKTPIFGILHWPRNYDPAQKYPVVESIYAGPQGAFVPKSFRVTHGVQRLADRGFIVVQIDGMGTSHRSKAFHDVCWKNLVDGGLPDRVLWLKAAAREYPALDLSRVGIYGTSAGGQSALAALLTHGDFYQAAVADSGCHDNRMDKIWWNELWMGWPVGPHYAEQSNVTLAHRLKGKLLLMAGELDRNVDPASTMQVVNALIKHKKEFELLIVPSGGHGIAGTPYGQERLMDFFIRALGPVGEAPVAGAR